MAEVKTGTPLLRTTVLGTLVWDSQFRLRDLTNIDHFHQNNLVVEAELVS